VLAIKRGVTKQMSVEIIYPKLKAMYKALGFFQAAECVQQICAHRDPEELLVDLQAYLVRRFK